MVNLFIFCDLDTWSKGLNIEFILKDCLFGNVKIAKNSDPGKYSYSEYGIGFDSCSPFSIRKFDWGKNVIIFGFDMSSCVHINNKRKDILILGKGTRSINFTRSQRKFCSSLHCNGSNSFLFVNATKIYQFKAKDSETKKYHLCLGNNSFRK